MKTNTPPANGNPLDNPLDAMVLDRRFTYHPPRPGQPERYQAIRAKARELAELLLAECPRSADLNVALERIDEAVFWANASIARHEV